MVTRDNVRSLETALCTADFHRYSKQFAEFAAAILKGCSMAANGIWAKVLSEKELRKRCQVWKIHPVNSWVT